MILKICIHGTALLTSSPVVMFGKPAVHCPDPATCYCKLYGLCDLKCKKDGCESQYTLPKYATLPKGWPKIGWDGEDRHWKGDL